MQVRIIYRASHPSRAVALNSVDAGSVPFEAEASAGEAKSSARPGSRSKRLVIRSLALFLVRLGVGTMVMAAWRIATDLGLPIHFIFATGILAHWQVWFAAGVLLVGGASLVARRLQFNRAHDDRDPTRAEAA